MPRLQPPETYEYLHSSSSSDVHYRSVLQFSRDAKPAIVLHIEGKLIAQGINEGDKLGSNASRAKIDLIVEGLKTEPNYRAIFNKALIAGEPLEDVNLAIRQLVQGVQHQVNKRGRGQQKAAQRRQNDTQNALSPFLQAQPYPSTTCDPNPQPVSREPNPILKQGYSVSFPPPKERLVLLYIDGEEVCHAFSLNDLVSKEHEAASDNSDFQFSMLKTKMETQLKSRVLDWSHLTAKIDDFQIRCDCQDAFKLICRNGTAQQPHIVLKGLRVLTPRNGDTRRSKFRS
jgi:hypothetical protein